MRKVYANRDFTFEAAHCLPNYQGACANLHGHSYKLRVTVSREFDLYRSDIPLPQLNPHDYMVVDFGILKKIVEATVLVKLDHAYLNEIFNVPPTAEAMAAVIFDLINDEIKATPAFDFKLEKVALWETEKCFAEYCGEKF